MTQPITWLQNWLQPHPEHKWLSYLPVLCWAGLIFWFSSQSYLPKLSTPWTEFLWKKTAHFLVFGGLYFWLWWSQKLILAPKISKKINSAPTSFFWLGLVFLYAVSDEIHQVYVVNRHPSFTDVGIDMLGAISFALALWHYSAWPNYLKRTTSWLIPTHSQKAV